MTANKTAGPAIDWDSLQTKIAASEKQGQQANQAIQQAQEQIASLELRRKEAEHKDERVHRVESFYGRFSRSFRLPEDADVSAVQAESRNGVLKVRVPKLPAPKPKTVEVQVN